MSKLLFAIEYMYGGGAERVTSILVNELARKGHEVHLLLYGKSKSEYHIEDNVKVHHIGINKLDKRFSKGIKLLNGVLACVKQNRPDVLVSLARPGLQVFLLLAAKKFKIKLVLSERNAPNLYPREKWLRIIRDICYKHSDLLIVQTKEVKGFYKKFGNKVKVIPNPVKENLPIHRFRESKSIVNFCRLAEQKNLTLLIKAFSMIDVKYSDYTLEIYGDGDERDKLETLIIDLKLQDKVFIKKSAGNIHEIIRDASLFVCSSDYEGMSNSMLEALAMGIPSICTDCPMGGARMVIEHGFNGWLVPVNDIKALVEAINTVLGDKALQEKLSKNAIKIRDQLSKEMIVDNWEKEIEKMNI